MYWLVFSRALSRGRYKTIFDRFGANSAMNVIKLWIECSRTNEELIGQLHICSFSKRDTQYNKMRYAAFKGP